MNFKRFSTSDNQWHDVPYYQHKTATDTLTLPAVIYPNDTTVTVGIKGNTTQSGTPSPSNPVDVNGTGERTGNLFDGVIEVGGLDANTGAETEQAGRRRSEYIEIEGNTNYNLSRTITATTSNLWVLFYDENKGYISGSNKGTGDANFTVLSPANAKYLRWYVTANGSYDNLMIIEGSTAPSSYIPYGYKIPISSANTTTPVYLGEVQTERKIKKLVLTGNETFFRDKERADSWRFYSDALVSGKYNVSICSHFAYIGTSRVNDTDDIGFSLFSSSQFGCRCPKSVANTVNEFKAWLAAQYSAGTPVTVWYVLATETTGIVNEPLRKIGGYADTVSGITIPTITGKDSFDVLTTLKPSEVSLTYTGWHDATVKEWDGTDWQ